MKGFWRKVLLTMGFAPLLFFFNEFYLKKKFAPEVIPTTNRKVIIQVESPSAPSSELRALVKKVAKRSTEADLLERSHDFAKDVKEILPLLKEDWQEEGKALLKTLEECQIKDFCDMKPDADGYFDESETHARKSQVRLLNMLNQAYEDSKNKKYLLPTNTLESFLSSGNDKLVKASVKQLLAKGELQNFIINLNGAGSADALVLISKTDISTQVMVNLIETALIGADAYTVVKVFEELDKMKFNEAGFISITKRVCRLKDGMIQNWLPIVAITKEISKKRSFSSHAETICQ